MRSILLLTLAACVTPPPEVSSDHCDVSAYVKGSDLVATAKYQCANTSRTITAYLNGFAELSDDEIFQFGTHVQLLSCDGSSLTMTYPLPKGIQPDIVKASAGFDQGQVGCLAIPSVIDRGANW